MEEINDKTNIYLLDKLGNLIYEILTTNLNISKIDI